MQAIKEILRLSDLFLGLSSEELDKVILLCRREVYEVGVVIFPEGAPCNTIYIVESGKVALEMNFHISRVGEESATITVVSQAGCLCCSGLIDPYILTATGRTLEQSEVIALNTEKLVALLKENSEIGYKVMRNAAMISAGRLEHTRDTLGNILSVIFHDLKSPLAAIESYHRVMLGGFAGELNDEQKNMLQRGSKRVSELRELLSNIMDVSRVDTKDLVMNKISLEKVIMDCVEIIQPLAEEKGLQLKAEVAEGLHPVYGDRERLKQVVLNLLSDGVKFTPHGGMVTVTAKDGVGYTQVEVADTGIGIPAEELPKIFDDFYRGLNLAEKGSGLGLSIAKRIVEAHRGKIWVVSPYPGSDKGTKFIFTLPNDLA